MYVCKECGDVKFTAVVAKGRRFLRQLVYIFAYLQKKKKKQDIKFA